MKPVERFFEREPAAMDHEPELTVWLTAAFERCLERFPALSHELENFASSLGERFAVAAEARASLASHAIEDLFVAWASARGVPGAIALFERDYLVPACRAVRSGDPAELAQSLRLRLLVAEGGQPPRVAQYTGRGPLLAWVRMAATRATIDLSRKAGTEERARRDLAHATEPFDPELDYLKVRYAEPFREALERALRSLSERDATLIKLAYLEDVSPSAMARMHGVSTRTIQRWIADARASVLDGARRILSDTLNVAPDELDGLMRLAQSRLKVTLERVLGKGSETKDA